MHTSDRNKQEQKEEEGGKEDNKLTESVQPKSHSSLGSCWIMCHGQACTCLASCPPLAVCVRAGSVSNMKVSVQYKRNCKRGGVGVGTALGPNAASPQTHG